MILTLCCQGKNLKMHLFHNVTFLYYHNRAITVVANTMGSKKKHLRRVTKLEFFLKGGNSERLQDHTCPWGQGERPLTSDLWPLLAV